MTEVITAPRTAREVLAWSREAIDPALRAAVDTLPAASRHIAGYHFGWWDEEGRTARGNGGKAIRPALTLLAAEAVGGGVADALPAATAIELVHNHSLVHDDVMDRDPTRRHRPTAWHVFGVNPAIQAGDALVALAFGVLADAGRPAAVRGVRMVNAATQAIVDGQLADLEFEGRGHVDVSDCVRMAAAKTGALMACACAIGAVFGGGRPEQVEHLRAFGGDLGLAFQHVDDLLGIWGDPAVTGKPVHADLRRRKKSLPVVAAMTSDTTAGRELAALYLGDEPLSDADARHAADLIDHAGGAAWSRRQVDLLLASALDHLRAARPRSRAADELFALARLATHRDH
ncbi:family 2 encapsulin nanocompartment cargo protein polyprenyl transferase [Actinophytocola sp.]|uniref:family 2 encapsulin nanocompartment cargo protein polyprenyl transferase n=1 Tax=Actinophytocola sp. TaxID=1872138 RepID=UPI003D6BC864